MKKTNSVRVAAIMLALTMITGCFVGGTFAKYVTKASSNDSAKVAKFGVEIKAGDKAFATQYAVDDKDTVNGKFAMSVDGLGKNVVAPGTEGSIDLFTIKGQPEVAVKIDAQISEIESIYLKRQARFVFEVNVKEWEDGGHFEMDMATGDMIEISPPETQEELEELYDQGESSIKKIEKFGPVNYYPVKWTLIKNGDEANPVATGTLENIQAYLNENINGQILPPNTDLAGILGGSYKLKWAWKFYEDDTKDVYDTALGNIAANPEELYGYDEAHITEAFNFSITVTQID